MRALGTVALLPVLLTACSDNPPATVVAPNERPSAPLAATAAIGVTGENVEDGPSASSLTLPFAGSVTSDAPGFLLTQFGRGGALVGRTFGLGGRAGWFEILDHRNVNPALEVETQGTGPAAFFRSGSTRPTVDAQNSGGPAAVFRSSGGPSSLAALEAHNNGRGRAALFNITNTANFNAAVEARTVGSGMAVAGISFGTGAAGLFLNFNLGSSPALTAQTHGTGDVLRVNHAGASGSLAVFQSGGVNQIRFTKTGLGIFDGGTQTGGADVAEAFAVEGNIDDYAPGDVLVISTRSDRRVEKSADAYSTRLIGVYAVKPGVLLTERSVDASLVDLVPVGVIGVIPTRVSAENGAIQRGDLLVSARTSGHAMRGDPDLLRVGMVLGKALQKFAGPGTGMIQVLVNVK